MEKYKVIGKCVAISDHTSINFDELNFSKDDIIDILLKDGDKWYGKIFNEIGWFNSVQVANISTKIMNEKCLAIYDYSDTEVGELAFKAGDVIEILQKENNERWFGRKDDHEGWFWPTMVEVIKTRATQIAKDNINPLSTNRLTNYKASKSLDFDVNPRMELDLDSVQPTHVLEDVRKYRVRKANAPKAPQRDQTKIETPHDPQIQSEAPKKEVFLVKRPAFMDELENRNKLKNPETMAKTNISWMDELKLKRQESTGLVEKKKRDVIQQPEWMRGLKKQNRKTAPAQLNTDEEEMNKTSGAKFIQMDKIKSPTKETFKLPEIGEKDFEKIVRSNSISISSLKSNKINIPNTAVSFSTVASTSTSTSTATITTTNVTIKSSPSWTSSSFENVTNLNNSTNPTSINKVLINFDNITDKNVKFAIETLSGRLTELERLVVKLKEEIELCKNSK